MRKILSIMLMTVLVLGFNACSKGDDSPGVEKLQPGNDDGTSTSEYVKTTCYSCNGDGKCTTCNGSGKGCKTCNGTGKFCSGCGGKGVCWACSGRKTCISCGGSKYDRCYGCSGTGKCSVCNGAGRNYYAVAGWVVCSMCSGTGNCSVCYGSGKVKCWTCNGSGYCDICNGDGLCHKCWGAPVCNTCGGDGHCPACKNSDGVCVTCEGKGYVWTLPGNSGNGNEKDMSQGTGTKENPFNVAAAIKKCKEIGSTESAESYYVKGIVYANRTVSKDGDISFELVDSEGTTGSIRVYRAKGADDKKLKEDYMFFKGATAIVCGPLVYQNNVNPEIIRGFIVSIDGRAPELQGDGLGDGQMYTCCPDNNHPHMIDLGLPSETKWACCNVGASTPEGYGGYYACGETEEKESYNWDSYLYGSNYSNLVDIGSEYSGTSYDVAHVKWKGSWRMPTRTQCYELINYTTSTWGTQNGKKGRFFKGKNGGEIFMPAAGDKYDNSLREVGERGVYSNSTISNVEYDGGISFNDERAFCYSQAGRYAGHTVRPVSK